MSKHYQNFIEQNLRALLCPNYYQNIVGTVCVQTTIKILSVSKLTLFGVRNVAKTRGKWHDHVQTIIKILSEHVVSKPSSHFVHVQTHIFSHFGNRLVIMFGQSNAVSQLIIFFVLWELAPMRASPRLNLRYGNRVPRATFLPPCAEPILGSSRRFSEVLGADPTLG